MNNLLIFFAIPVATIILSVVLQKVLRSPFLVGATAFAVFLIVTFSAFDESFLVFAILYTLLALITAIITRFICCLINNSDNPCFRRNAISGEGICGNNSIVNDDNDENDNENGCSNNSGCGCNRSMTNQYFQKRYMMRR